jgi:hypothetical protein
MSTRIQSRSTRSNEDALAAFVSKKAAIDAMLTRLQTLSADHFGYAPDDVTWSHVSSVPHPPRAVLAAGARGRRRALVLSADGDHPMTRLSDTQLVILTAAAHRADLSVLPLPETLKLKGGAFKKVMDSLRNRGLIRVLGGDGGPERMVITSEGMAAVGVETEGDEARTTAATAPTSAEAGGAAHAPAGRSEAGDAPAAGAGQPAKRKAKAPAAKQTETAPGGDPSAKPTPRAGTKQALMIELLRRPEGATVEQIAATTGWQHHTVRGAISGALKKKLGLTVEATRTREVGPNKTGAKGSTVYRILEPA